MPTITLNRKVFEKLVGKKLPLAELKERISMLGTDLESVDEETIEVEVFPNRPDMLSEQGFARAFSSFIGVKTGLKKYKIEDSKQRVMIDESVAGIRPFTACAIVKNLKFDDEKIREIIQIQEKLHITYGRNRAKAAIGIYPLEKIKTPIRYLAMNPKDFKFRPLEYPEELNGLQILQKHPAGREYAHLLEGLDKFPVFIDANDNILSMPPIINSHLTGKITEETKEVFIECSGFDFDVLRICLNIIITALADMGGKAYSMILEYPKEKQRTPDLSPNNMKLEVQYCNDLLGLSLSAEEQCSLLEKMGFGIQKFDNKNIDVLVPAYRADVIHPVDLAEDIAIAYGYENFVDEIPNISTIGEENPFSIFKKRIADILVGLGLVETNTYHLTNETDNNKNMNCSIKFVSLANSLSSDYTIMRSWMIPSLIKVLSENKNHEYPQNIFEIGTIFKENKDMETCIEEHDRLCVALCSKDADFTRIKQVLDSLFNAIGDSYESKETEHSSFIPGRVARISAGKEDVAYIGEIHPEVLEKWGLEMPVACFELNLTILFKERFLNQ